MARAADARPGSGAAALFAADDEVGHDLAVVDWAATPLGPPGSWPQSLQTAVDILLSSRFSMWMAWGAQLTFFCNAAYREGFQPFLSHSSGLTAGRTSAPQRVRTPGF